jgi:hypothetical protein
VGATSGTVTFSNLRDDDINRVVDDGLLVRMEPLDALTGGERIALLKADVEGYERFVIEGATETLKRTEAVYFESWDAHFAKYGYRTADVVGLLTNAGFQVFRCVDARWRPLEAGYGSAQCENLLAVRDRRLLQRLEGD